MSASMHRALSILVATACGARAGPADTPSNVASSAARHHVGCWTSSPLCRIARLLVTCDAPAATTVAIMAVERPDGRREVVEMTRNGCAFTAREQDRYLRITVRMYDARIKVVGKSEIVPP
jgi:hypothetical protein